MKFFISSLIFFIMLLIPCVLVKRICVHDSPVRVERLRGLGRFVTRFDGEDLPAVVKSPI